MELSKRFTYLLNQYLNDTISSEEKKEYFDLVASGDFDDIMNAHFDKMMYESDSHTSLKIPAQADQEIFNSIIHAADKTPLSLKNRKGPGNVWYFAAAATLIFIISLTVVYYSKNADTNGFASGFKKASEQQVSNTTNSPLPVLLGDGSRITLEPGSALYYSAKLLSAKREVYMEGEAKFEITKDPARPFYVYYHDVVTKVLGTSFHISTNKQSGTVEVEVLTGKVQVYENDKIRSNTAAGVIVTPNQKAVYQEERHVFAATLVEKPVIVAHQIAASPQKNNDSITAFVFEDTRLSTILKELELNYGIAIEVSNNAVYNCAFSGDISKQNLYDKLKIICLATGSEYRIEGTEILITGKGCK